MNELLRVTIAAATAFAVAFAPASLRAQVAPADTAAPIAIDTLMVTILRTPLELRKVPHAVTTIDLGTRAAAPGLALDEALRAVPGVQIDNRYNHALGERIAIRGFGARPQFGVRGVKVVVDGIPATMPDGQTTLNHVDVRTLGRVEVVRSGASSLYGNAAGGVIQLETRTPPAGPVRQELEVLGGDHGLLRLNSRTGGRSGRASYQLTLGRLAYDGHRDHNAAENLYAGGAFGLETGKGDLRVVFHAVDYDAENPGALSEALLRADRTQAFANNVRQRTGEEGRHAQLGARWRQPLGNGELEVSAYALTRRIDNPIPPQIIDLERRAGGVRAVYRGTAGLGGRELLWTLGAEADLQSDDRRNFVNEAGERGALSLDQDERVSGVGAFLQLSAPLGDRVALLGGIRYDRFGFRATDHFIADGADDSGDRAMDALSPSLGVALNLADAFGLYASVGTAFQTPTTTELANRPDGSGGFNPELEPQRATTLEAGARGRLGSVAAYQLAFYRAAVENELIGFEVPAMPGRTFFRNAGSAIHRGIEAEASVTPVAGLLLRAAYAYTDARFDEYRVDDDVFDDNRIPGVAPHRFEATLSFRPGRWILDLSTRYLAGLPVDDANTAESPAYAVTDIRAGLARLRVGGIDVAPFVGVDNVFDREYNASVVVNAFGGRYFEPGPGRSLFAGATIGFGGW